MVAFSKIAISAALGLMSMSANAVTIPVLNELSKLPPDLRSVIEDVLDQNDFDGAVGVVDAMSQMLTKRIQKNQQATDTPQLEELNNTFESLKDEIIRERDAVSELRNNFPSLEELIETIPDEDTKEKAQTLFSNHDFDSLEAALFDYVKTTGDFGSSLNEIAKSQIHDKIIQAKDGLLSDETSFEEVEAGASEADHAQPAEDLIPESILSMSVEELVDAIPNEEDRAKVQEFLDNKDYDGLTNAVFEKLDDPNSEIPLEMVDALKTLFTEKIEGMKGGSFEDAEVNQDERTSKSDQTGLDFADIHTAIESIPDVYFRNQIKDAMDEKNFVQSEHLFREFLDTYISERPEDLEIAQEHWDEINNFISTSFQKEMDKIPAFEMEEDTTPVSKLALAFAKGERNGERAFEPEQEIKDDGPAFAMEEKAPLSDRFSTNANERYFPHNNGMGGLEGGDGPAFAMAEGQFEEEKDLIGSVLAQYEQSKEVVEDAPAFAMEEKASLSDSYANMFSNNANERYFPHNNGVGGLDDPAFAMAEGQFEEEKDFIGSVLAEYEQSKEIVEDAPAFAMEESAPVRNSFVQMFNDNVQERYFPRMSDVGGLDDPAFAMAEGQFEEEKDFIGSVLAEYEQSKEIEKVFNEIGKSKENILKTLKELGGI